MDSGHSGSISSSGDDEYESRSDHHNNQPIPSFLMNPSSLIATTHFGSNSNPNNNPPTHLLSHHNNIFDHHNNSTFFLNLDTARSALMRSDHHHNQQQPPPYGHLGASASSLPIHHSLVLSPHNQFPAPSQQQQPSQIPNETVMTASTSTTTTTATTTAVVVGGGGGSSGQPTPARASKKRTRASRRAPTTVLTTDTSNFRAMVQEFTGIPAPPFSANSSFSRRFDLFGRGSALEGPLYPHLVRPSAIKPQPNIVPASYGQPSDHQQGLMRMNMASVMQQNQGLNMGFQLQSLPSLHLDAAQTSLGLDQQHLSFGTASNRVSSDGVSSQMNNVWRGEGGGSGDVGCKMNFTAAVGTNTSEFHGEKGGLEINVVSSRGTEGTVDSWIFPSD